MGDRALITFKSKDGDCSPYVYLHWEGYKVKEFLEKALPRLRQGDPSYSCARFIGILHEEIDGNLSLGVFNGPKNPDKIKRDDSHGDNGIFIVDVSTGEVKQIHAYDSCKVKPFTLKLPESVRV